MSRNLKRISVSGILLFLLVLLNAIILEAGFSVSAEWYALLVATVPLLIIASLLFLKRYDELE